MANSDLRPILVTGAHRSGTTWVGKMLAASPEVGYISEPLNVLHRPGVMLAPTRYWYTYVCEENANNYLPALQQTLRFRYHWMAEIQSLGSRKDLLRMGRDWKTFLTGRLRRQRPLLKDPFAVFSTPWFAEALNCRVVITIRHPAAFASSLKRLGWDFDFADLLAQPLLMRDRLEPFRAKMQAMQGQPQDIIGQSSLLWCMVYQTVGDYQKQKYPFEIVRHEDLSRDPLTGYEDLYRYLNLAFTPEIQSVIENSSSSENPQELSKKKVHAVQLDSRSSLDNWKRRLSTEEIDRIRRLTEDVASLYYSDEDWK